MKGLVTKSTGSWYEVLADDGNTYNSRIKGKFRTKDIKTTNPIAVGDWVDITLEAGAVTKTAVIEHLHERKNYIIRKSINLSKQAQIIAANPNRRPVDPIQNAVSVVHLSLSLLATSP